ncbi:protein translocase subunit SecD [Sedimentisphaera salicampi]|uniref:protein translocase subunit SecD n=1 Tax=Sedimentisphaera salicampi TaxID=1941349 RepID=UPI000B9C4586|nr:protein translocase subunit SecD [Sedimentisphaera salicampi]OXU14564.1 bifunctional preprotein translocase subunit SecD/SecF [Sedimentisphaera salicampi]
MEKKQHWKGVLILVLVVFAALSLWPPQSKLKPGLDLAGGASLVYSIDTEGMSDSETDGLAAKVIPVIKKRLDPDGLSNIVIRPQGDTRFEIQLPLASEETQKLREKYQKAYDALADTNINLAVVINSLSLPEEERQEKFKEFAKSDSHRELLNTLASIYDKRQRLRDQRDSAKEAMENAKSSMEDLGMRTTGLQYQYESWSEKEGEELTKALNSFVEKTAEEGEEPENAQKKVSLLKDYIQSRSKYVQVVDELAGEVADKYKDALNDISKLNISLEAFTEMLGSSGRQEYLAEIKNKFPDRIEEIENFVSAYDSYAGVRGRLDDPEDVKRMLKGAGVLEFRIIPRAASGDISSDEAQNYIQQLKTKGPKLASDSDYVWCEVDDPRGKGFPGSVTGEFAGKKYVLASNKDGEVLLNNQDGKDWKLAKARRETDQAGRRAIGFQMNEIGANMFYDLTDSNMNRQLGVLLDGKLLSSATIQAAIGKRGIITGNFSQVEQADMVNKLNAGSLPARISPAPISEKTIGATIGEDNRDKGITAGIIGLVLVMIFMLIYYTLSGSIADIALLLNMLFILGVMAFSGATFTLPGIAGLILTIGMAVDANVLIFERIREEQESGATLKTAIKSGYDKAFSTIFDANITTFITAFILYKVASEEIKGFAIVLMIGIVSSMFTALFVSRTVFQWLIGAGIIKDKLVMLKMIRKPNVQWMNMRFGFFAVSGVVVVTGLFIFFARGSDKYDIEFTGGTSVQVNFKENVSYQRDEVEKKIKQAGLESAEVYSVGDNDQSYEIITTETNKSRVKVTFEGEVPSQQKAVSLLNTNSSDYVKHIEVSKNGSTLEVSTSQLAKSEMRDVLSQAFSDYEYEIGEQKVDEVVNNAIIDAFGKELERRMALGLEAEEPVMIDDKVADKKPVLLNYIGGLYINCQIDNSAQAGQIEARLNDLRFKPDMRDLTWFKFHILSMDGEELDETEQVSEFKYVALHPDAGSRELTEDEIENFKNNELAKIKAAAAIETSLPRVTQINPSIGSESQTKALVAIVLSLIAIIAYIWIRFGNLSFGLAAIAALVHDVCITLGILAGCVFVANTAIGEMLGIRDFKINLEIIAAFLTIIGYSLNDTIVVFDRIRENRCSNLNVWKELLNRSINQTLSRTILTSATTFVVVLIMYIWGGVGLRGFTFAMLLGVLAGTYSSIAIASPVLLIGAGAGSKKAKSKK